MKGIAVTAREGIPLGVFRKTGSNRGEADLVVNLARTGAFFSNNQAPLSSRTVRFISGIHFPPGVSFTPNAALSSSSPAPPRSTGTASSSAASA